MCNHFNSCCYCHQYCSCCGSYLPNHYWWCHHYRYVYIPPIYSIPIPYVPQINIKIELPKPIAKRKSKADW